MFDALRAPVRRLKMWGLLWMHPTFNLVLLFPCINLILYIYSLFFFSLFFNFVLLILTLLHAIETLHCLSIGMKAFTDFFNFIKTNQKYEKDFHLFAFSFTSFVLFWFRECILFLLVLTPYSLALACIEVGCK